MGPQILAQPRQASLQQPVRKRVEEMGALPVLLHKISRENCQYRTVSCHVSQRHTSSFMTFCRDM